MIILTNNRINVRAYHLRYMLYERAVREQTTRTAYMAMKRYLLLITTTFYYLLLLPATHAEVALNGVHILTTLEELVESSHTVLVVVDMQNAWISTEGMCIRPNKDVPPNLSKHNVEPNRL